jgi:ankyrin repeat protein
MPAITIFDRIKKYQTVARLPTLLEYVLGTVLDDNLGAFSFLVRPETYEELFRNNNLDAIVEFEKLLDLAAELGRLGQVSTLCAAFSASPLRSSYNPFFRALCTAARKGHPAVAEVLSKNFLDIDSKDPEGHTPLFLAVREGHRDVVAVLVRAAANVNVTNPIGSTPLLWAASEGDFAVVQLLLANGADVNVENEAGCTPLLWAASEGHEKIVTLLLEAGGIILSKVHDIPTPNYQRGPRYERGPSYETETSSFAVSKPNGMKDLPHNLSLKVNHRELVPRA